MVVGAGEVAQVGDAGSARLQAYGSLAAVWKLLTALAQAEGRWVGPCHMTYHTLYITSTE